MAGTKYKEYILLLLNKINNEYTLKRILRFVEHCYTHTH